MRKRLYYFMLIIGVISLGLLSREVYHYVPTWIGDVLWGLMVFFMMGFIFKTKSTWQIAIVASLFSIGIEIAKLYHAPWIEGIRYTRLGGLVLGYVFSLHNIALYIVGIFVGVICEKIWKITNLKNK